MTYGLSVSSEDLRQLFDYSYWANRQILEATCRVDQDSFVAHPALTYRSLRDTLVFALDVEQSWRFRLRGEPRSVWDQKLEPTTFPDARSVSKAWCVNEAEMMEWLSQLGDGPLDRVVDLGSKDRFPLSYFLLHILTHTAQLRRDSALLIRHAGETPPEIDFLYYADQLV